MCVFTGSLAASFSASGHAFLKLRNPVSFDPPSVSQTDPSRLELDARRDSQHPNNEHDACRRAASASFAESKYHTSYPRISFDPSALNKSDNLLDNTQNLHYPNVNGGLLDKETTLGDASWLSAHVSVLNSNTPPYVTVPSTRVTPRASSPDGASTQRGLAASSPHGASTQRGLAAAAGSVASSPQHRPLAASTSCGPPDRPVNVPHARSPPVSVYLNAADEEVVCTQK